MVYELFALVNDFPELATTANTTALPIVNRIASPRNPDADPDATVSHAARQAIFTDEEEAREELNLHHELGFEHISLYRVTAERKRRGADAPETPRWAELPEKID